MLRNVLCLAVLLIATLPAAPGAQQFGGSRRVEIAPAYPFTAGGKQFYLYLLDYAKQHLCEAPR